jgi:hypothetical protein
MITFKDEFDNEIMSRYNNTSKHAILMRMIEIEQPIKIDNELYLVDWDRMAKESEMLLGENLTHLPILTFRHRLTEYLKKDTLIYLTTKWEC